MYKRQKVFYFLSKLRRLIVCMVVAATAASVISASGPLGDHVTRH